MVIPVLTQTSPVLPSEDTLAIQSVAANSVPSQRQTAYGIEAVGITQNQHRQMNRQPATIINHPRLAPSTVTSEQFMSARAGMSPGFVQQMAASKIARISNLYADTPRFSAQIDILA
jgi:hypothetical protein